LCIFFLLFFNFLLLFTLNVEVLVFRQLSGAFVTSVTAPVCVKQLFFNHIIRHNFMNK